MNKRMIAALLAVGLGATACSGDAEPSEGTDQARDYYEDYGEQHGDEGGAAGSVNAPDAAAEAGGAEPGAVAPPPPEPPPHDPFRDNYFEDVGETLWTDVAEAPESTFALDVDTGSYRVANAFLEKGSRPDPDSIRVEEWVNAFDYGDAPPEEDDLGLVVESGHGRAEEDNALVRVGVTTRELSDEERPPANITFVVDTSGSMDLQDRLGLVQASLAMLVENLNEDDTISIVTYGDHAEPVLEPTPVAEAGSIYRAIDRLKPGGSTNMEAGLREGYEQARTAQREDGTNVVVLASDGVANVGTTEADPLVEEIVRAGEQGIHLVTVGYGMGNYNDTLMEQLANQGDGFYSYIDTFAEAEQLFVEELTPTLTVVAADSKAQVVFDEEQVDEYRLIGYQNRELDPEDFTDDTVDAGELGAGHQVSALYEVVPAAEDVDPGEELGQVSLRWRSPEEGVNGQLDAAVSWPEQSDEAAGMTESLRMATLVADTAELLKGNEVVAERGVSLSDLSAEAEALVDQEVAGATEILDVIQRAQEA
ncbi:MAG TPA: von Willebrand factor type A domain-containing protein [Jiangellaceae bacterium]|nr:von Willebrand factor type A domain-containing protein [Jiangellaceae bacterium]